MVLQLRRRRTLGRCKLEVFFFFAFSSKLKPLKDCRESRPYSAPKDPCAFGSHNASRGPFGDTGNALVGTQDAPRPAWMDDDPHLQNVGRRGKEANMKRNRAAEASTQDRNEDDWFSRAAGV
jgi:hypothetical protein